MADIHVYPFLRHLRGSPTSYVRHVQNGRVVHEDVAESFWFRPLSAVLSESPSTIASCRCSSTRARATTRTWPCRRP